MSASVSVPDCGRDSAPTRGTARPPCPVQRPGARMQLINAQGHRGLADPGGAGHQPDPATWTTSSNSQTPLLTVELTLDVASASPGQRRRHPLGQAETTRGCAVRYG